MRCKFIDHGVQIYYSGVVKPCCALRTGSEFSDRNHITKIDLDSWHHSNDISRIKQILESDQWPKECHACEEIESMGRGDSIRLGGEQAYSHYQPGDITLEIRPGNTCNFACQTCWPQASSRVSDYYKKVGIGFDPGNDQPWDYTMISPILPRIRDVVILGGEPFYDKKCTKFLDWLLRQKHHPKITMFTNGSMIDFDFLDRYRDSVTLVFSLDAVDRPAEYIRFGTEWFVVSNNYQRCRTLSNVNVRVNITTSVYNYPYITQLLTMLCEDWPEVVSWGVASQNLNSRFMGESTIPSRFRGQVIASLEPALEALSLANIEKYQKINAINCVKSIIDNLQKIPYDPDSHDRMKNFILLMDQVKNIRLCDYCPEVADYLETSEHRLDRLSPVFFASDNTDNRS